MKWVDGNIYHYESDLVDYFDMNHTQKRHALSPRKPTFKSRISLDFVLVSNHEDGMLLHLLILNSKGNGQRYNEWLDKSKNGTVLYQIESHIGFTDITHKYSTKDLEAFKKLSKLIRG